MTLISRTALAFFLVGLANGSIISESSSKLPMGLSTVISDLEAEGVESVSTACFLSSRGVTQAKKAAFFGTEEAKTTCFGTGGGLCLAVAPVSISEVVSTAVACGGSLIYYADADDLSRGEGLFDTLGPAMERILNEDIATPTNLIVIASDAKATKQQLETAAADVLANLATSKRVSVLEDVFANVQYVATPEQAVELLESSDSVDPATAQAGIAEAVASDFWQMTTPTEFATSMSPRDLAAARQMGPAARKFKDAAIQQIKDLAEDGPVTNFGDLCVAASQRALDDLDLSCSPILLSSNLGREIRQNLKNEILAECADVCQRQLDMLQDVCFDEFNQQLSKLRLSPNLATDMDNVAKEAMSNFASRCKKMPAKVASAKMQFKARVLEFCSERLLAARASGQFRPVPRKGVTIGLHWLLPKPFGNDYRQEPWMVHATDDLVYVPDDKITDVNPQDVANGDWRRKIVPSPAGNEMIYMQ